MKRLLLVVTILISLALVLVSCNVEAPVAGNKLCLVTVGDNTKALNASASSSKFVNNLFWYYTAQYVGSSVYRTGETTELTPIRGSKSSPEQGFAGSSLGYFSTGRWSFSLWGFNTPSESADPSNAVFYQEGLIVDLSNDQHYLTAVLCSGSGNSNAYVELNNLYYTNASCVSHSLFLKVYSDSQLIINTEPVIADNTGKAVFSIPNNAANVSLTDGSHILTFIIYEDNTVLGYYQLNVVATSGTVITISGDITTISDAEYGIIAFSDNIKLLRSNDSLLWNDDSLIKEISISDENNPNVDLWNDFSNDTSLSVPSGTYKVHIGLSDKNGTFGSWDNSVTVSAGTTITINQDIQGTTYTWRTAFGVTETYTDNGYTMAKGLKSFTDSTTYTYKYVLDGSNQVVTGETVTENNTLKYWLHEPFNYDSTKTYPIMVFIHGSGGCLFYQNTDVGGENARYGSVSRQSFRDNESTWTRMLAGAVAGNKIYPILNSDGDMVYSNVVGEDSGVFISAWFDHVKAHPEDDCFFIAPNLNDEMWFENRASYQVFEENGVYKIDYSEQRTDTVKAYLLDIVKANLAGDDYGSTLSKTGSITGNKGRYNITYKTDQMDMNVWFQLLAKLEDKIVDEYRNGRPASDYEHYIVGASLGGVAVYDLIVRMPKRYAGAVAYGAPGADITKEKLQQIKTNVVALHGTGDTLVSSASSEAFIDGLNTARGNEEAKIITSSHSHWPPSIFSIESEFYSYFYDYLYGVRVNNAD